MNKPRLDLNLLPALAALVDSRGVSAAARSLGLSQPAMSHALSRLRATLDDPVLVRGARGMVPTPRALELVEPVRRVLGDLGAVLASPSGFAPARWRGVLRLAVAEAPGFVLVPRLLERLASTAPGVDLSLVPWSARATPAALASGDVDLAVLDTRIDAPDLRRSRLVDDRLVVLTRAGHPRLRRRATARQLAAESFVRIASPDADGVVDDLSQRLDAELRYRATVTSLPAAAQLVARSELVAVVSERAARAASVTLPVATVLPMTRLGGGDWWLCWHSRAQSEPWMRWLQGQVASVSRLRDKPARGVSASGPHAR